MEVIVLIPAFNEEKTIGKVIGNLKNEGFENIVVVNDGSTDQTEKIAEKKKATVLTHIVNRGLGASLKTGFEYAKKTKAEFVVTFDADGQHRAEDIKRLVAPLKNQKADVVIGSRLLKPNKEMPFLRKMVNWLSNILTFIIYGIRTSDSQSGLRALNRKALALIELKTQKMEVSSEIFKEIKRNGLRLAEIPIRAIYSQYSQKKGQKIANAPDVFSKIILRAYR